MNSIKITEIFKKSLSDFKKNWKTIILSIFLFMTIAILTGFNPVKPNSFEAMIAFESLFVVISFLITSYITITFTRSFLKIVDGKQVSFSSYFTDIKGIKHYMNYILTNILVFFIVTIFPLLILSSILFFVKDYSIDGNLFIFLLSIILFILYTLIVLVFMTFVTNFAAEGRYFYFKAIKKSFQMAKNNFWKLVLLILATLILNILGILVFLVGLLVTIPITWLMYLHFYRSADPEVKEIESIEPGKEQNQEKINLEG